MLIQADAVDCCSDAMAGLTSQPHMGALIHQFAGTALDTGISLQEVGPRNGHGIATEWSRNYHAIATELLLNCY